MTARTLSLPPLLLLLFACGRPGADPDAREERPEYALPVRTETPARGEVEDWVTAQATLESDRQAAVHAQVEGEIVERARDVGARVGEAENGEDPFLLARIDDRDLRLTVQETGIRVEQARGRLKEKRLGLEQAERQLDQARVELEEAEAAFARAASGITDGTISIEEHEGAQFARDLARSRVEAARASLEQAQVAVELAEVAIDEAGVARDRAELDAARARLVAPFPGVVTMCNVRVGELVRRGDLLYRIEDPATLVVYADVPVRQASRVSAGDEVRIVSNAAPLATTGRVLLVAPTVDRESGTVRVKVRVDPAEGFRPGLFVTLRIVVARRPDALVVPKRAVLHDDEDGAYLFVVDGDRAERRLVRTGFEGRGTVEIADGVGPDTLVVVEGQDTLADGAKVAPADGDAAPADAER